MSTVRPRDAFGVASGLFVYAAFPTVVVVFDPRWAVSLTRLPATCTVSISDLVASFLDIVL